MNERSAGEASTFPALSLALTKNRCEPLRNPEYDFGDEHRDHEPESNRHSNDEPTSEERNPNDAEPEATVPDGPETIDVWGATRSTGGGATTLTVNDLVAGEVSVLPALSVARTENLCEPFDKPEYAFGFTHFDHEPPSNLHWNDDPGSDDLNLNDADLEVMVPDGPEVIDV